MRKIKLFCLPYAGGSATVYSKWKEYLRPEIELIPVELAGRGKRIQEDLYKDMHNAVEEVFQSIRKEIQYSQYILFGHSMGSMIIYELIQKIKENNMPSPAHVFFSGGRAPHTERNSDKKYHLMDDEEFRKEVLELGGTPPEFFEYPELLEIILPMLKNDFRIAETYIHQGEIRPLDHDITVLLGKDDELTPEQCHEWRHHTSKICNMHYFEGGHFFLHDETRQITNLINQACEKYAGLSKSGNKTLTAY